MSVASFIERMRGRQADLFSTTVQLSRRSGLGTFDEDTASYGEPTGDVVYLGAALVRPEPPRLVEAGEAEEQLTRYIVKLPVNSDVRLGDMVAVTESTYDAGLVGVPLRVVEVLHDEWQIARVCRAVAEGVTPT